MPAHRKDTHRYALTKILATLGPASDSEEGIRGLIEHGVDCFRLNFSHGTKEEHGERLARIRKVSEELDAAVAVLGDLPGPKIRVGKVPPIDHEKGVHVQAGESVVISGSAEQAVTRQTESGREVILPTTYPEMIGEVVSGQRVLINDGAIRMLAIETRDGPEGERELVCRVTVGGLISNSKGINLPETAISAPAISDRDWEMACWAVEAGIDFLAMSFVRSAEEIREFRSRLSQRFPITGPEDAEVESESGGQLRAPVPLVAKIEKPQAVRDIDAICKEADILMVARGDLGVEMDIAEVPVVQKRIVQACEAWGTPVIVATQMLETMIENAIPTRAESTDVANAVLDGADAVMLSGETAVGRHPQLVVDTMSRIIDAAEESMVVEEPLAREPHKFREERNPTAALAHGAWHTARDAGARLIICWSEKGGTAQYLSRNHFTVPIVSYSSDIRYARRMALLRGVLPFCATPPTMLIEWYDEVDRHVKERGLAEDGDVVLLVAGRPLGRSRRTNTITLHAIGLPHGAYAGDPA